VTYSGGRLENRQIRLAWFALFMLVTTFIPIPFSL